MSIAFKSSAAVAVLTTIAWMPPAEAQVVNGGFETGTFAGWTQTGDTSFSGVDAAAARSGAFGAFFGPTAVGGISQSFATVASASYQVSFSLALPDSAQPNSFAWTWNGVSQSPLLTNSAPFGFTNFSALLSATGPVSTIAFAFSNPQSFYFLDNVSVTAIPEPPEVALMAAGLIVMLRTFKRRGAVKTIKTRSPTFDIGSGGTIAGRFAFATFGSPATRGPFCASLPESCARTLRRRAPGAIGTRASAASR